MTRTYAAVGLCIVGVLVSVLTVHSLVWSLVLFSIATVLSWQGKGPKRSLLAILLVGLASIIFAGVVRFSPIQSAHVESLRPGQYTASSRDLMGLVTVRVVLRGSVENEPPVMIFAEAHAPPFMGIDQSTLSQEVHRVLVAQGINESLATGSDSVTARLVHSALKPILAGSIEPVTPVVPEGAARSDMGPDTYFGMFPNEYDHRCDIARVPDGLYTGQSSNPLHPARVEVEFGNGKLVSVRVLDYRASSYGQPALAQLPPRMVQENRVDVDVVSGATRTSYILRSAALHACLRGLTDVEASSRR